MRPKSVLRLARVSNTPTVLADLLAGWCVGAFLLEQPLGPWTPTRCAALLLAALAVLAVYHGAMVLNDLLDLEADRIARPSRPLPAGEIGHAQALALLAVLAALAALGIAGLAFFQRVAAAVALALFAAAAIYDLWARRSCWSGPLLLGLCRGLNLALGMVLGGAFEAPRALTALLVAAAYSLYIGALSALARMEDSTPRPATCRAALVVALVAFCAPPFLLGAWLALPLSLVGALFILAELAGSSAWTRARTMRTVGRLLRLILVFDAALCLGCERPILAGLILLGYPLAARLARSFPPT